MVYSIRNNVLTRDGRDLFCPFRQPVPISIPSKIAGQVVGVQWVQHPCGLHCPLFEYVDKTVHLRCGNSPPIKDVQLEAPSDAPIPSKVLKLVN